MQSIMTSPFLASIVGFVVAAGGGLLLLLGLRLASATEDTARLREYVVEEAVPQAGYAPRLGFRQAELTGTLRTRLIEPLFQRVGRLLGGFTPARVVNDLQRQLALAGNPLGLGPREFYGLRLVSLVIGLSVAFTLLRGVVAAARPTTSRQGQVAVVASTVTSLPRAAAQATLANLGGGFLAFYLGLFLPRMWLRRLVRARQNRIRRSLPDALDMLSVCADAGLGFDQALQRVSERWKTPLGAEFARVVAEMQMGVGRQAALRNLADRLDVSEVSSFVAIIVQSDQLGMSIVNTLRSQAEQMRVERRHRAQEEARKAPLKMLFPMLLFIFPAMLAVVIGPAVPQIRQFFATLRTSTGAGP